MPKKVKLSSLKIKSFVTTLTDPAKQEVIGGVTAGCTPPLKTCPLTDYECSETCGCPTGGCTITCDTCVTNCNCTDTCSCGCTDTIETCEHYCPETTLCL